jgi:hypothetical protein
MKTRSDKRHGGTKACGRKQSGALRPSSPIRHRTSHIAHRTSRGAAMSEMVLAMPFLILILSFIIYFGRGVTRVQHAEVMDRYEAWREAAKGGPGPHVDDDHGHTLLNQAFFADNAQSIGHSGSDYFPDDAPQELSDQAHQASDPAGDLADTDIQRFPKGRTVAFSVRHDETVRVWQPFQGAIHHHHTRLDGDWRFADYWHKNDDGTWDPRRPGVSVLPALRDVFYKNFDDGLVDLAQEDNSIAKLIRQLYLDEPDYRGPTVYTFQDN